MWSGIPLTGGELQNDCQVTASFEVLVRHKEACPSQDHMIILC